MGLESEFLEKLTPSAIRDITASIREKKSQGIDVTNFAGGMPDSRYFPEEELKKITEDIFSQGDGELFQYAATDGYEPLREALAGLMERYGVKTSAREILITSGSAQALNYLGRALLREGSVVACEKPVYVGAVDTLKSYGAELVGISMEEDGMNLEELERVLKARKVSFIYTIPDFQNPTGCSLSAEKREKLARLARRYDTYIVEDSPYSLLSFRGTIAPAVKSFDEDGRILFLGSVSKTICPGLRVGWVCGDQESIRKLIYLKQRDDLQVNNLAQRQVFEYLMHGGFDENVREVCKVYQGRLECMTAAVRRYFPKESRYVVPAGGIFLWIELGGNIVSKELFPYMLAHRIAFVPGTYFYPDGAGESTMRLNFCTNDEQVIFEKVKEMGQVIQEFLNERKR